MRPIDDHTASWVSDPREPARQKLRMMPVPIYGFADHPDLRLSTFFEVNPGHSGDRLTQMAVKLFYTVKTKTSQHDKASHLDAADDTEERPPWLQEWLDTTRKPFLWSAVQTTWFDSEHAPVSKAPRLLAIHIRNVLLNSKQVDFTPDTSSLLGDIYDGDVIVDGVPRPGVWLTGSQETQACGFFATPECFVSGVALREVVPERFRLEFKQLYDDLER